ncbi:MAG: antibiotic biosynthesis monooxygenase [Leptospira sp.]|nr:antibiotic biosynthesis monooxygenase [Leptospira sp.]
MRPFISATPAPPYYAVIFTNIHSREISGYEETAERMLELAKIQRGFLGVESTRNQDGNGITVSYWNSLEDIRNWKEQIEHRKAQESGKTKWYLEYTLRIAKVETEYSLVKSELPGS